MTLIISEEELRSILDEGQTLYKISRKFNTTAKEVFKLGRSYGISFDYYHTHIPRPTKEDVESMYTNEEMHQWEIAKEFGVTDRTVSSWLRLYNIPTRGSGTLAVPIPHKEDLERMYTKEGMNRYQISRYFNVSEGKVQGWILKYRIPTRGSKGTIAVTRPPKEVLERMYIKDGMATWQIGEKFNVTGHCIVVWLHLYNIPVIVSKIPPKEVLERMYIKECMTQEHIASKFDVVQGAVYQWIHKYGISTVGRMGSLVPIPPKDDIISCIDNGLNQLQIAEKYGVHDSTIFKWCEKLGIPGMVNSIRCTTPEHQEWRYAVFDRDHRTCQMCGATNTTMQPHHIVPYRDHPEIAYELDNGVTLCKECHKKTFRHEYDYIQQFAAITQPHLRDHEVIESMPWEEPLPPLSDELFPDYPQQEVTPCLFH